MGQFTPVKSIRESGKSQIADHPQTLSLGQFVTQQDDLEELSE